MIPTLAYAFFGARAQPALDASKAWLTRNSTAVMAVLFLAIGAWLLLQGVLAAI